MKKRRKKKMSAKLRHYLAEYREATKYGPIGSREHALIKRRHGIEKPL